MFVLGVLFHYVVYFSVHGQEQSKQMWNRLSCVWRGSLVEAIQVRKLVLVGFCSASLQCNFCACFCNFGVQ